MALLLHIKDSTSPIGHYIKQRFSQTKSLTKEANRQLGTVDTPRPGDQTYPYPIIGTAIDYRIRYAFDLTPYRNLAAWEGATQLAFKPLESESDRPVTLEDWIDADVALPFNLNMGIAEGLYPMNLLQEFFGCLETFLKKVQPVGRCLDAEAERMLARYCYVLSLFEQVFRVGYEAVQRSPLLLPTPKQSVEALLAIPQEACVEDVRQLFTLFFDRCQHLLSLPFTLNPSFPWSNGADRSDADLIVDGCLIDIKASVTPKMNANYLYQLVGYLLLDYDDSLKMNATGIYMARQGILFTWSVPNFVQQLTGDSNADVAALREDFRNVCQRASKSTR